MTDTKSKWLEKIAQVDCLDGLEALRLEALGKKGEISLAMRSIGKMDVEERKVKAPELNALKNDVARAIAERLEVLEDKALDDKIAAESVDITLPARARPRGSVHPITRTMKDLEKIFANMGFEQASGPDVEDDWHNFTALNFPPDHPAREMQDTFFLNREEGRLMRTHTSCVQIRHMMNAKPPFRVVSMGRTYRCDSDATHSPMFHQMEALVIGKDINMGHLKSCLQDFLRAYFDKEDVPMRLRPSFFPFVEPGAEVDIKGEKGWMEVLGSGMVHPNVLKNCGINPDEWQGFAFGAGIERLTMLRDGLDDLRPMFDSDPRWLAHYG